MMLVKANEATATKRRVGFFLVDATDLFTPENGEAGGQPQISIDGGTFSNGGIGTLVLIGNGEYYADIQQAALVAGRIIRTRYKSANTAECPGDTVQVMGWDPSGETPVHIETRSDNVETAGG